MKIGTLFDAEVDVVGGARRRDGWEKESHPIFQHPELILGGLAMVVKPYVKLLDMNEKPLTTVEFDENKPPEGVTVVRNMRLKKVSIVLEYEEEW